MLEFKNINYFSVKDDCVVKGTEFEEETKLSFVLVVRPFVISSYLAYF